MLYIKNCLNDPGGERRAKDYLARGFPGDCRTFHRRHLTPAEISVLRLIAAGRANKEIADQLSTTEESVKSRVRSILSKLGASDRTHATTIALKRGIIEL